MAPANHPIHRSVRNCAFILLAVAVSTLSVPHACAQTNLATRTSDNMALPGMVRIEAGPFLRGTTQKEATALQKSLRIGRRQKASYWKVVNCELVDERNRATKVPTFLVDIHETTNLQFCYYIKATGAEPPKHPNNHRARWRGGRLPGATSDLFVDEVLDWKKLIEKIKQAETRATPGSRIFDLLDPNLRGAVDESRKSEDLLETIREPLVTAITEMLHKRDFYDSKAWAGRTVSKEFTALNKKGLAKLDEKELARFNRLAIDSFFDAEILPGQPAAMQYYPVTAITPYEMRECARWMGKRMLTENEWEKAARGPLKRKDPARQFPWGDKLGKDETGYCNWGEYWRSLIHNPNKWPASLTPVGQFPRGRSTYGIQDVIGNALEVVWSPWAPPANAPRGVVFNPPADPNSVILKGGAFGTSVKLYLRIPWRHSFSRNEAADAVGFRCAKELNIARTRLARTAETLFAAVYDKRLTKLNGDDAVAGEKATYLSATAAVPIITAYEWMGLLPIKDHSYDSHNTLKSASDRTKRKDNRGRVLLGMFHTDIALDEPKLPPGTYAVTFQRGFKNAKFMNANLASKRNEGKGGKAKPAKKAPEPKKDEKKAEDPKAPGKPGEAGQEKPEPGKKGDKDKAPKAVVDAPVREAKNDGGVPEYSTKARIVFVNARNLPVAAVAAPTFTMAKAAQRSNLTFVAPTELIPMAHVKVTLGLRKKFDANKTLVGDFILKCAKPEALKGWTVTH